MVAGLQVAGLVHEVSEGVRESYASCVCGAVIHYSPAPAPAPAPREV
jgi:hypothetical protein